MKVRKATQAVLAPLKYDINILLTQIDYMEYTFVQVFHSLAAGDALFTNQLIELYQTFGKQLVLSNFFRSQVTFQTGLTYGALDTILNSSTKVLKPIPQDIINGILSVTNISSVFDEASRRANFGIIKFLQTYVSESERCSALETAWEQQRFDIVKMIIKSNTTFVKPGMSVIRRNFHGETILHLAVELKNPHFVKNLLESGAKVNTSDPSGATPLYRAVKANDIATAKILIEKHADVNAETKSGKIALHEAAKNGDLDMVTLLLASGSTANKESAEGLTPLLISEKYVFIETIDYLFWSNTINVKQLTNNIKYLYVMTSYESANRTTRRRKINIDHILEHSMIAKELILRGEKTYIPDDLKREVNTLVLRFAIIKLARSMSNIGSRLDPDSRDTQNIFRLAIANDNHELVALMLSEGMPENIKGIGRTINSLQLAADHGSVTVFYLLLNRGADVPKMTNRGSILHAACAGGKESIVRNLLNNGSRVDSLDREGNTPLFYAAIEGKPAIVKLLIDYKANINARNEDKDTALHFAVIGNDAETVNILIEKGANIEARNNDGETPLFVAAIGDDGAALTSLIKKGAVMETEDISKRTALEAAISRGYVNATQILLANGLDPNMKDAKSRTSLHLAVSTGSLELVELLLKYKVSINIPDSNGRTALHEAIIKKSLNMVQLLVNNGVSINAKDNDGRTPLDYALTICSRDIASFLAKKRGKATILADPKCLI